MYPKKTKHSGILLRSSKTIQITMYFGGHRETETLTWEQTPTNLKECYKLKLAAETGYKNNTLNYATLFPDSNKIHKYVARAGDSLTIIQRFDLLEAYTTSRYEKRKLKASTYNGYLKEINRLKTYFSTHHKKMRLSELTDTDLDRWVKRRNIGNKAITEELKHIRSIIHYAKVKKQISDDVLAHWKPETGLSVVLEVNGKKTVKKKYQKHPFTKNEINKILASTKVISPEHYSFILFRFALGMRPAEIIGLTWKRYNELDNSIYILETVVNGRLEPTPKTAASERPLKLNKAALTAINIQKELTYKDGGFIFTNPLARNKNGWWSDRVISYVWKKILAHAGLEHRRPYNTRHSYATELLKQGESILNVSEMLGHSDMRITMEAYAGGKRDEAIDTAKFDDVIEL